MAQYNDDLDETIALVEVGSEYIDEYKYSTRFRNYGNKFTNEDTINKKHK